jgi:hypothetical protein
MPGSHRPEALHHRGCLPSGAPVSLAPCPVVLLISVCILLQFSYKFCEENKIILIWNWCIRVQQIYTSFHEFHYRDMCWFPSVRFQPPCFPSYLGTISQSSLPRHSFSTLFCRGARWILSRVIITVSGVAVAKSLAIFSMTILTYWMA